MDKLEEIIEEIKFDERGLIPTVIQDYISGQVLMVAYMNRESLTRTIKEGRACFWSRSRQELWTKGETSGNYQLVEEMSIDCDSDTLLFKVKSAGPACHTGHTSCFYRDYSLTEGKIQQKSRQEDTYLNYIFLKQLYDIILDRQEKMPEGSYTTYLFTEGIDKVAKKMGEETAEVIIAAKNENRNEITYETADLIYHLLVLLALYQITPGEIIAELESRHK